MRPLVYPFGLLVVLMIVRVHAAPMSSRPASLTSVADITADCYLRAFAVEFATWLQPQNATTNWTSHVESGMEMGVLCNSTSSLSDYRVADLSPVPHPASPPLTTRDASIHKHSDMTASSLLGSCPYSVYVDGVKGDDKNPGTETAPVLHISPGLSLTRLMRVNRSIVSASNAICLVLRAGVYYLGTTTSQPSDENSSRVGSISLTSFDSGLTITAYPGEENEVVLSGGVALDALNLQWTTYKTTPQGNILTAKLPTDIGLDLTFGAANELYTTERRLIRAKYPNSDPSTQGLWTEPTGYFTGAERWLGGHPHPKTTIVSVSQPSRNGTVFPFFQEGVGGRCEIFDPPAGFWCSDNPPAGAAFNVPGGLMDKANLGNRMATWTNPSNGYIHAFHGAYWGSWVFAIDSIDRTTATINFGIGGTQEARGAGGGNEYYVSNILEELDVPGEWYVDAVNSSIYFMPNKTGLPSSMVLSQLPCIISVSGSMEDPASNITIYGLTLTQTANTYMRWHEMPSGGDWSIHRGAAVFVTGSSQFTFTHNRLTQLGSNGVFISNWNHNATISENEMTFLGQTGVLVVGSSHTIDAISNVNQPNNTFVHSNLIHDIGIYIKQSAGIFNSIARCTHIEGNVLFNGPRMQTQFNDGFAGGHVLAYNLGFNCLRETGDAGVYESWDRQPYLTLEAGIGPSLQAAWSHEHHNYAYVNYRTDAVINHDDGSSCQLITQDFLYFHSYCRYEDYFNLFVYCGYQTYLGHNKHYHDELTIYPDVVNARPCFETNVNQGGLSFDEVYQHNTCVNRKALLTYGIRSCDVATIVRDSGLHISNITFYYPEGVQPFFPCQVNGTTVNLSLDQWQKATGLDLDDKVEVSPDIETVIVWARQQLMYNNNMHSRTKQVVVSDS